MPKFHLMFSHALTEVQKNEVLNILKCSEICEMPNQLKNQWKQIPPENEIPENLIKTFTDYILNSTKTNDYVLVSGDYGMSFLITDLCLNTKRIPVYATTKRVTQEIKTESGEIEIKRIFKHVNFRKYRRP